MSRTSDRLLKVAAGAALAATAFSSLNRRRHVTTEGTAVTSKDGTTLNAVRYEPAGEPRAAVVLSHGWTMSHHFWEGHARTLAEDHGLLAVTYDQRGHGLSSHPRGDAFDLHHLGDDLDAVLEQTVDPALPILLVGHSMGAMTIMAWAGVEAPVERNVVGAVLANTAVHAVAPEAIAAMTRTNSATVHRLVQSAVKVPVPIPPTPVNQRVVGRVAHGRGAPVEAVALTTGLFMACHPRVRVGFGRQILSLDLRERAARLDVPTLVVSSSRDLLTPPAQSRMLVELLPQARLAVLEGAGHQAPIEQPEAFTELLLDHLESSWETLPDT